MYIELTVASQNDGKSIKWGDYIIIKQLNCMWYTYYIAECA